MTTEKEARRTEAVARVNAAMQSAAKPPVGWSYKEGALHLAPGVDWADPMVRAEVRSDARTLMRALGRDIAIYAADGARLWGTGDAL